MSWSATQALGSAGSDQGVGTISSEDGRKLSITLSSRWGSICSVRRVVTPRGMSASEVYSLRCRRYFVVPSAPGNTTWYMRTAYEVSVSYQKQVFRWHKYFQHSSADIDKEQSENQVCCCFI